MLACAGAGGACLYAQQTDVIRGRIIGPDSLPLAEVSVKARSYAGGVEKSTRTDKDGRFALVFINGEGDYWIELSKIGYAVRRFEVKRIGDEEVLIANARLSLTGAVLGKVDVVGERNRLLPNRTGSAADVGGGDRSVTTTGVSPDQAGNLAAMAASVAGIQIIPGLDGASDMFSMLGLSGDQNNTTFDGLGSGVSALPPDILATTSIRPYPFDPSIGGFSGAQIAIQTIPGSNFSRRLISSVDIVPPLQWADERARAQGQTYTNVRLGGNAAGPIVMNRAFYNAAYNVGRQFSDLRTVLNTNAVGLTAAGISPDSAKRLVSILRRRGIPTDGGGLPRTQERDVAQLSGNVDVAPSASGAGHAVTAGGAANYQRTGPVSRGGLLLTTPAHGGDARLWGANATLSHSAYFGFGILTKTTLGFAGSGTTTSPYQELPEGSVRVSSTLPDGGAAVRSLLFGGNGARASLGTQAWQLGNQLTWYAGNNEHTLKITSGVTRDAFYSDVGQSVLGTFGYNSLADLEAGRPASFTRTFAAATQSGTQLAGWLSLGDYWRPTDGLQVQYGIRADANRFAVRPTFNATLRDALGIDNSRAPNRLYLSPRVGLQWHYGKSPQVTYAPGSARPPRAVIHAGIGVFQNVGGAQLISSAVSSTGLPSSAHSITCVGAATPQADWEAFAVSASTIPTRCADDSDGTVFATVAPNVSAFDPDFRQPSSLRAAADWSGPVLGNRFVLGVQGIASWARAQPNLVDVNLNPIARFALSNEAARPVFVEASSIVPGTGVTALVGSRASPAFQHVWVRRSDLRAEAKQLSVNVTPVTANPLLRWDATYTMRDARETFGGFASTAANPFDVGRGQSLLAGRHEVSLMWMDFPVADLVYVTGAVRLASGMWYTPMIAGDVNGDGVFNDRAFIIDPAQATDARAANAMRSRLADASPSIRRCLEHQFNTIAARGSCRAPWRADAGLFVRFNPQKIGLPKRTSVTLALQNPLALADLALHGSHLRGWGQNNVPDQNLLFVRAFDPATRRFIYDVNERFGSTRPQQSSTYALPYVSVGVRVDIGVPRERQLLTQRLDAGRAGPGTRANADVMTSFGTSAIPNPMALILQEGLSLELTRAQADTLAMLSRVFAKFADSVWTPAGRSLATLPARYNSGDAYAQYVAARVKTVDFLLAIVPDAKRVLTATQRRKLPRQIANFLDERVLKFLRTSTLGDASVVIGR